MSARSQLLAKQVELAAARAHDTEAPELVAIFNNLAARQGLGGNVIEALHSRRLDTVRELLALRLHLEEDTPRSDADAEHWYNDLVGSIYGISDSEAGRLLRELEQDAMQMGGGPLPEAWRRAVSEEFKCLQTQFLKQADILRDRRELEATMPRPISTEHAVNVTLNISHSSVANLNLGTQIGSIENTVSALQSQGLEELAQAVKRLAEEIMATPAQELGDAQKREAIEHVGALGEEFKKPPAERRLGLLRSIGSGVRGLLTNVDKLAAAYELVKAAARTQNVELP